MATPGEWLTRHVKRDHLWLLERLRSLDNCLENLLYYGEVCGDLRGFGGLRLRCRELEETLRQHIPLEEEIFARLDNHAEVQPLVAALIQEHRRLVQLIEECLVTLTSLERGDLPPENLSELRDRVRTLSTTLQHHIATEDQRVFPLLSTT